MQKNEKNYLENQNENTKRKGKKRLWITLCSFLVVLGVLGVFIRSGEAAETGDDGSQTTSSTVNERLVINITTTEANGLAGETLSATVVSKYSKANDTGESVRVVIKVGKLPQGITLAGFDDEGKQTVIWKDANDAEQSITLELQEQDDETYVTYTQPQGSTLEFDLQFNSLNGVIDNVVMEDGVAVGGSFVRLEVDKDQITGLATSDTAVDKYPDPVTLTWSAKNEWDPVVKKVNNEKSNTISVSTENKLSGVLTYTISAIGSNQDAYGEIWTDYIIVTDTLVLPEHISLPENAEINDTKDAIVIETNDSETTILSFVDLPEGTSVSLDLSEDKKTITYSLMVNNTNRDDENVPTKEMENLSLKMILNAEFLVLEANYIMLYSPEEAASDIIQNTVEIQPMPYRTYEVPSSEDVVTTVPILPEEKFELKKSADQKAVLPGGTITYHLTLKNTGEVPLTIKADSTKYMVTDVLPSYLKLTEAQIEELQEKGCTITYNDEQKLYTISWVPCKGKIAAGASYTLDFSATVRESSEITDLENGSMISNQASYQEKTSNKVDVPYYEKALIEVKKESEDESKDSIAQNGEKITYTITVTNTTDLDATIPETITDILPEALRFESMTINQTTLKQNGTCLWDKHQVTVENETDVTDEEDTTVKEIEHNIEFTVEGQTLSWNVGCLKANEVVTITYLCIVNTDYLTSKNQIQNTVKGTESSDSDTIGVKYPISINKEVQSEETKTFYEDGDLFKYTITVTNDSNNPSEKDDHVLVDQLPEGMYPYGYELNRIESGSEPTTVEWNEFVASNYDTSGASFTTIIPIESTTQSRNITATVKKVNNAVQLSWDLGKLDKGEQITVTYKVQLNLVQPGKKQYTNTATIDGISDSVEITGGQEYGKLTIHKTFVHSASDGIYTSPRYPDEEELSKIKFTLTGIDKNGNPISFDNDPTKLERIITWDQFTETPYEYAQYNMKWLEGDSKLENLPIGTYTIKEEEYSNGKIIKPDWFGTNDLYQTSGWEFTFEITSGSNKITVRDSEYEPEVVNLQKSVYEIAKEDAEGKWTSLSGKKMFTVDDTDDTKTLVVYNITVSAATTGESGVEILSLTDKLPDGVTYLGIYNQSGYTKNRNTFIKQNNVIYTTDCGLNTANKVEFISTFMSGGKIEATYDQVLNEVHFTLDYNGKSVVLPGNIISFLMLCEVDTNSIEVGQMLENTVELVVPKDTQLSDIGGYETINTPYDANQNNGDLVLESQNDTQKVISSSVSITPEASVVPGIEKNAVAYIPPGKTIDSETTLKEESNIPSNSVVKWEVKIYNDGTRDMVDYAVEDIVTSTFHLMTREEAQAVGINTPYTYQIYEYSDTNMVEIGNYDLSDKVWETVTDATHDSYRFEFQEEQYAIPSGSYALLTLYTNNTAQNKKIYTNTATVYPSQDFTALRVSHGELVKDSDGKFIGVKALDEVYALGDFASVSWKTIAESSNASNKAQGNWSNNYISVELNSDEEQSSTEKQEPKLVTYTNNIRNISTQEFYEFVLIDLMPMKNDTGVVNQDDNRASEFSVYYAGNLSVKVLTEDEDGNVSGVTVDSSEYTIEFSNEVSFTEADFAGQEDESRWHSEWVEGDCSFRVIMGANFRLEPGQTLVIQYDGRIDSSATPGAIAWNSFGYQYYSSADETVVMRAEPPKVGVRIKNIPIIQKEVVDTFDKIMERDANITFTFELREVGNADEEDRVCQFTLCQGGYQKLSNLTDTEGNKFEFENDKTYVIKELEASMPDGYELVGIGETGGQLQEGEYSFVYDDKKDINIRVRNKVTNYVSELPATGSVSALAAKAIGMILLTLSGILICGYILRSKKEKGRG